MSDLEVVVVPKNLYYHEVAYVRRLEALVIAADKLINDMAGHEGAEGFSESTKKLETEYNTLYLEHKEKSK